MNKWTRLLMLIVIIIGIGNIQTVKAAVSSTIDVRGQLANESSQIPINLTSKINEESSVEYSTGGTEIVKEVELTDTSNIPEYVPVESTGTFRSSGVSSYSSNYGRTALGKLSNGTNMQLAYDSIVGYLNGIYSGSIDFDSILKNDLYSLQKVDISSYKLSKEDLLKVVVTIRCDHPEFFWLSNIYSSTYDPYTGFRIDFMAFVSENFKTKELRSAMKNKIQNSINEYMEDASSLSTDYEVEKLFHDKIIKETIYDPNLYRINENINNHNIAGVFVDHVGVCESYAKAMQLLLNAANIDNVYVVGAGNRGGHAWNQVKLGDSYYNLDVTWDDLKNSDFGGISYEFFNTEDEYFNVTSTVTQNRHEANTPNSSTGTWEYLYPIKSCSDFTYSYYNQESGILAVESDVIDNDVMKEFWVSKIKNALESNNFEIRIAGRTGEISQKLHTYFLNNVSTIVSDSRISSMFLEKCSGYGNNVLSNMQREIRITLSAKNVVLVNGISIPQTLNFDTLNESYYLNPIIAPENADNKDVTWESSNSSVATVVNGVVTAIAEGTARITCTANDGSGQSAICTVVVTNPVNDNFEEIVYLGSTYRLQNNKLTLVRVPNEERVTIVGGIRLNGKDIPVVGIDKDAFKDSNRMIIIDYSNYLEDDILSILGESFKKCDFYLGKPGNEAYLGQWWCAYLCKNPQENFNYISKYVGIPTVENYIFEKWNINMAEGGKYQAIAKWKEKIIYSTGVKLDKTNLNLERGNMVALVATVEPSNVTNKGVTWKSSNPLVATVDATGKVTAVGAGSATITATAKDGSGKYVACKVTVTNPIKVTSITLSKPSLSIVKGNTSALTATILPSNATNKGVTWKSSNPLIATVDASGKVTAVGAGTATITCTAKDGSLKHASCKVTVVLPTKVTSITLSKSSLSIVKGYTSTLTATVAPTNATNKGVTWKSSNPLVATVDATGKVTAVGAGNATITATAKDGSGKYVACKVTVTNPIKVTSITLSKPSLSIVKGNTSALTATILPSNATNKGVTWKSSNAAVATVDATGKVTAVGAGSATITATAKDGTGKYVACKVTVTNPIKVTSITLSKLSLSILKGNTSTLTSTILPSNATNKGVTWKSSNPLVATVDATGKVTATGAGNATITTTAKDGSGKYVACKVIVTNPIKVKSMALSKTSLSIVKGKTSTLIATILPSNATNKGVTWKSSNPLVATVDSNGKVTGVLAGSATITATAKDGSGKNATCTVTVTNPVSVSRVTLIKSLSIEKGKTSTLTATIAPTNAMNKGVTWKSSDTSVVTVDSSGKITAKKVGTATITVKTTDGSNKSATCTVKVVKAVTVKATGVKLNTNSLNLTVGKSGKFTATITPTNVTNKDLTWATSNNKVATIDQSGNIKAVGAGTAVVTCTAKDGSGKYATCKVTVTK